MESVCQAFHRNPLVNPRTGRAIGFGAKTYRDLVKECGPPPNIPMSPTVLPQPFQAFPNNNIPTNPIIIPQFNKPILLPPFNNPIPPFNENTLPPANNLPLPPFYNRTPPLDIPRPISPRFNIPPVNIPRPVSPPVNIPRPISPRFNTPPFDSPPRLPLSPRFNTPPFDSPPQLPLSPRFNTLPVNIPRPLSPRFNTPPQDTPPQLPMYNTPPEGLPPQLPMYNTPPGDTPPQLPMYNTPPGNTPPPFRIDCPDTEQERDAMQYGTFLTVHNKYILGEKIFDKNKTKVRFMRDSYQITEKGYNAIMNVINLWEEMYYRLFNDITNKREFTQKAAQGGRPRKLITDKDWGEALIELVDSVNKYHRDVDLSINLNTDPKTLKDECFGTSINDCSSPCSIQKGWLGGYITSDYCDYTPK